MKPYEVELAPAAERMYGKLPDEARASIRRALLELAETVATPGRVGGKRSKTIKGVADSFHRLRVGDFRVMYDVFPEDRVVLVLGIVHRSDLERWLRSR